ncbi:MAG: UPF0223 family protein [Bacilli bacterium]|nr:UPF0223 family protein [Bacilli bacterium]
MYSYPIDYDLFTQEEIITLVEFFSLIEDANEGTVDVQKLLKTYNEYRQIINSVSLEKQMEKEFEKISGYSIYKTLKNVK